MRDKLAFRDVFGGDITDSIVDPYEAYAELRKHSPCQVFETRYLGDMYVVTSHAGVEEVLTNPKTFVSRINNDRLLGRIVGSTIVGQDGDEHRQGRHLITPSFSPSTIHGMKALVRDIARATIEKFLAEGEVDLVSRFTFTFPLDVIAKMIGVHIGNLTEFHGWTRDLLAVATDPMTAMTAVSKIKESLAPIVAERREKPGSGVLDKLIAAEVEGRRMMDDEILSFLTLLLQAGGETTSSLIGSAVYLLLRDGLWQVIAANRNLLSRVFRETLRYESPIQFVAREAAVETFICGEVLPAGAFVVPMIGAAHRDPQVFDNPDSFDIFREESEWDRSLPFALGPHYCPGAHLAEVEFTEAMNLLLDFFPGLRLDLATEQPGVVGLAFRGPKSLPVVLH